MYHSVLRQDLDEDMDAYERRRILEVATRRASGREAFTFNVFNVELDFDVGTATVNDESDPTRSQTALLSGFPREVLAREPRISVRRQGRNRPPEVSDDGRAT